MSPDLETRMVESLRPLFGDFAESALEQQKAKLGIGASMDRNAYLRLIEEIKRMCSQVAGPLIADKVYQGLVAIVGDVT